MEKYNLLKTYFGYETFKEGQEEIINHLMIKDVLGIMPTGGGKSLCYQIPALMNEGVTLVISPLIALMKDQVDGLNEMGIPATYLNSTLSVGEARQRINDISGGLYKLIYVAPERLLTEGFYQLCQELKVDLVAVDEAHCISQWGHDFRPSYKNIPLFISRLKKRPIIGAFTATATAYVIEEIKELLELQDPFSLVTGFDRANLFYKVVKPTDRYKYLKSFIESSGSEGSTIVYCSTRKTVESLAKKLQGHGFSAKAYHAGLSNEERSSVQDAFMLDDIKIIVATNAFGMGIDKPDVRQVMHYNMPQNMEAYYQEAGRAGRDGRPANCILMYSPSDVIKQRLFMDQNNSSKERYKVQLENLQTLVNYCHTNDCLRNQIRTYFGEVTEEEHCGSCGNCLNDSEFVDMTLVSQKVLSCIYRTNQRFGVSMVIQVLRGSKQKRLLDLGLDKVSTYGIETEYSEGALRELVMTLIARGFVHLTVDAYPVLKLDESARSVLKGQEEIMVRKERLTPSKSKVKRVRKSDYTYDDSLFEKLLGHRKTLAGKKRVPLYVVFSNAVLEEMAYLMPVKKEEFLAIKGIGEKKFESYGASFMALIKDYKAEHHIQRSFEEKSEIAYEEAEVSTKDRYEWTYEVYLEEESLESIGLKRQLSTSTIVKHLLKLIDKGLDIDLYKFIDPEKDAKIRKAVLESEGEGLKVIKDQLDDTIDYADIELTLAVLSLES